MKISSNGIELIKRLEGFSKMAYPDTNNRWSIGYGHNGELNGSEIMQGMYITEEEATKVLINDLRVVEQTLNNNVLVDLSQNQFDALCSLVFNIGSRAFIQSHMLYLLNQRDFDSAADEFLLWSKAGTKKDYLLYRRQKEKKLFLL
ncbi:lysozyme [Escherichia coli]|uniref:lysozyme n=1 Tax=Escherichia coli TaxID=562 RepID=UPI00130384DE|nr:lysozyme [Escherichia coli]EEY3529525.1 lysozyme [Escherichia coli]EFN7310784.1 lysozyme [Escherichia coli]EFN7354802.1 lysozyme [Escherichia coli]EFN8638937.1 lysozyme [Escherichia coli]KAE9813257.1 glycoside hydrolase family protein [Escherichia coli]